MMKELFKFVGTAPYTFLGGLLLISELLPLPLPIQTREVGYRLIQKSYYIEQEGKVKYVLIQHTIFL